MVVMHVMKFGNRCVASLQHLDIEEPGNCRHLIRRKTRDKFVHELTPAPEVVVRRTAHLSKSGHCPLERMRMQVCHAWKNGTGKTLSVALRRAACYVVDVSV